MKIALIAMSGLRVYDPELSRVGMTLPGFARRTRAIASMPSLSLLTLAALTPERFEVEYHEVADVERVGKLPSCDLAAISTLTAVAKEAYRLAERYRAQGVTTVMGGLHVTACPEEALQHCDAVVVGEGEVSWPTLLDERTWEKCTLFDVNYQPKHMSVSALEQGVIALGTRLYSAEARQARTGAYRRRLRQSPSRRRRKQ